MKKRSAMLVAAGLVAALFAGGAALSFSLAGGTAEAKSGRVRPIVRTERRTVTVHRKADPRPSRVVTISGLTSGSTTVGSTASEDPSSDDVAESEVESGTDVETETDQPSSTSDQASTEDSSSDSGSGSDD